MLDINKQRMKFAKTGQRITIYDRDENGEIIYESYSDTDGNEIYYLDDDGNKIPRVLEVKNGFSEPKEFFANISNKLNEALMKEFGVDDSTNYAQIVADKGRIPLKEGDVIWKKSEIERFEDGLVDGDSADYTVKGVADEGITVDLFLLKKNVK